MIRRVPREVHQSEMGGWHRRKPAYTVISQERRVWGGNVQKAHLKLLPLPPAA